MLFRQHCTGFFLCNVAWSLLGNTTQGFFACAMLSQEYYNIIEQDCFMCNVVWSLLDNIAQGFLPVQCCPKSIKSILNNIFPMQCCLEPLGQHGKRLFQLLRATLS